VKDYYVILGVPRSATADDVRAAFRRQAMAHHPDRAGSSSSARFRDVAEAYDTLSDPDKRRYYDSARELARSHSVADAEPSFSRGARGDRYGPAPEPEPLLRETVSLADSFDRFVPSFDRFVPSFDRFVPSFDRFVPSFDALFDRISRNFIGLGVPNSERAEPLTLELTISPSQAAAGATIYLALPAVVRCPECLGTGSGWVTGCSRCGGHGTLRHHRTLPVRLPAGIRDGTVLEMSLEQVGIRNLYLRIMVRLA
jgi:DnaJ-class molecular chaperone